MKKIILLFVFQIFIFSSFIYAQTNHSKPKLVVGIVVDQMRWDYLYRFEKLYGADGFNRLKNEGFKCENTFVPYIPTYTAPGHASVYTGSIPSINGIIGNDWYDAAAGKNMYCTEDNSVSTVGSTSDLGKMSPKNLLVTTITDELRISSNFQNKVFGISLKDRGAILPAGHAANMAFWFDNTNGNWITSTFYGTKLPDWMIKINQRKTVDKLMQQDWNTLFPIENYTLSTADDKPYERTLEGEEKAVFPHKLSSISKEKYEVFKYTPFAASYTFATAKEIVQNEQMGKGNFTDMLTVSISSTDYAGHAFGPNSIEIEDTYLRLDRDIADFLKFLDKEIGQGNYLLFLTADHAGSHVPGFLTENKLPGGRFSSSDFVENLNKILNTTLGYKNAIVKIQNNQVYLNKPEIEKNNYSMEKLESTILAFLNDQPEVEFAFSFKDLANASIPEPIKQRLINGYNPKRSGQLGFVPLSGHMGIGKKGTTHGAWNPYDAHIPLLWFGNGIKSGSTFRETYMTDISPTLAALLHIQMPSGAVGKVIEEVVK